MVVPNAPVADRANEARESVSQGLVLVGIAAMSP
jgi:hypothetical protein